MRTTVYPASIRKGRKGERNDRMVSSKLGSSRSYRRRGLRGCSARRSPDTHAQGRCYRQPALCRLSVDSWNPPEVNVLHSTILFRAPDSAVDVR